MSRDPPSAPPSPPDPAELYDSAPAAADLDTSEAPAAAPAELLPQLLSGQEEGDDAVHKVDGVGESAESVADVAAADLAAAEASAAPAVKPKRIENRVRMVDAGSPRNTVEAGEGGAGTDRLRDAASTIQRALRAKREAALITRKTFNIAEVARAAKQVDEKKKLASRIAELEAAQLFRDKNWFSLRKHIEYHSIKAAETAEVTAEVETRDRHSLVSLAAPNEVDEEDERHLRDEQVRA